MNEQFLPPAEAAPPLLELRGVVKYYGSRRVLDGISFAVGRGGIVGLLGPNGCGKSTVIKLICGLLTPNAGEVRIDGLLPSPETAAKIAYLPDRACMPDNMKISAMVDYFSDFFADFDRIKAHELIHRLKLDPSARMNTLSKGSREKIQLILTMSRRASLYILDEPIGGVDPAARDYILETILGGYHEGGTILISTHLIADVQSVLDDVIFMADGRAALCASVAALREQHGKTVDELFREVYRC